jgi:hypothetical protein
MTMAARTRATTSSRSCGFWECAALRHSSQSPNATASLSASIAPSRHSFFGSRPSIPSRNYGSHCTCSSTSTTKNGSCRSTVSSRPGKPARPSLTLGPSRLEYTHRFVQETVRHYSPPGQGRAGSDREQQDELAAGTGIRGVQGIRGIRGVQGIPGIRGRRGQHGLSPLPAWARGRRGAVA